MLKLKTASAIFRTSGGEFEYLADLQIIDGIVRLTKSFEMVTSA